MIMSASGSSTHSNRTKEDRLPNTRTSSTNPTQQGVRNVKFRKPSILPLKGPTLESLKLVNILNNETCSPISFKDFSTFVTEKEHSTENLLFVIWYRSYEARWNELEETVKRRVAIPSTKLGDRYDPFRRRSTLGPRDEGRADGDEEGREGMLPIGEQPMREEAARAFSTFLRSGGSRALGVSDDLRQFARTCLAKTSAPECFMPIYEEVYQTLETQSLPHFLSYASANVNRPKQMFWYYVGLFDFLFGLLVYLVLTLLLPTSHFGFRAIRLISTVFTSFGCMQGYSAWRGFCSQVWNRSSRQLRPWEMDPIDDGEVSVNGKEDIEVGVGGTWDTWPNLDMTNLAPPIDSRPSTGTGLGTSNNPMFNENVFTTTPQREMEIELSPEVHPLTDLGDITSSPASDHIRPLPSRNVSSEDGDGKSEEMDEKQLRQLALRRSTIKVPDAALAFPISEDDHVSELSPRKTSNRLSLVTSLRPSVSSVSSTRRQSVISPIATSVIERSHVSPFEEPTLSQTMTIVPGSEERKISETPSALRHPDLHMLLGKFRPSNHVRGTEEKPKMFGPEVLVEDPRVKALFEGVVRDILVVGVIAAIIWIPLCLAVPCVGLV